MQFSTINLYLYSATHGLSAYYTGIYAKIPLQIFVYYVKDFKRTGMEKDFMDFDEKERNYNVDHIVVLKVLPSLKS